MDKEYLAFIAHGHKTGLYKDEYDLHTNTVGLKHTQRC